MAFPIQVVYLTLKGEIADNRDPKSVIVGFNAGYSERGTMCSDTRLGLIPRSLPSLHTYVYHPHTCIRIHTRAGHSGR